MNDSKRKPINFDYVECSNRIRNLRNERKESHARLAEVIDIDPQSLKNYEQAALHNGISTGQDRVTKIAGMNINTLCLLADHFGVSTDYLLGRTEIQTCKADIQAACKTTGLSEIAVSNICAYQSRIEHTLGKPSTLDLFLSSQAGFDFILSLYSIGLFAPFADGFLKAYSKRYKDKDAVSNLQDIEKELFGHLYQLSDSADSLADALFCTDTLKSKTKELIQKALEERRASE